MTDKDMKRLLEALTKSAELLVEINRVVKIMYFEQSGMKESMDDLLTVAQGNSIRLDEIEGNIANIRRSLRVDTERPDNIFARLADKFGIE